MQKHFVGPPKAFSVPPEPATALVDPVVLVPQKRAATRGSTVTELRAAAAAARYTEAQLRQTAVAANSAGVAQTSRHTLCGYASAKQPDPHMQ